jgi:hypothetical protein
MADIVKRLRTYTVPGMLAETEDLLFDAADEIERLRKILRALVNGGSHRSD